MVSLALFLAAFGPSSTRYLRVHALVRVLAYELDELLRHVDERVQTHLMVLRMQARLLVLGRAEPFLERVDLLRECRELAPVHRRFSSPSPPALGAHLAAQHVVLLGERREHYELHPVRVDREVLQRVLKRAARLEHVLECLLRLVENDPRRHVLVNHGEALCEGLCEDWILEPLHTRLPNAVSTEVSEASPEFS